jgi:fused signal recognition particle receptor
MADDQERSGWWGTALGKLKTAISRTKTTLVDSIVEGEEVSTASGASRPDAAASTSAATSAPPRAVNEEYLAEVEEKLIRADVGISTAEMLVDHMRKEALAKMWNSHDVEAFLKREFRSMLDAAPSPELKIANDSLTIILIVGVNGTGKTTSIGKLCYRLKQQGKKVLIAAGDTFRAAAETQLEIWAERAGVEIVRLPDGSDPGAVVFKAIERARQEAFDVLIIDTAGRLHNKANLMAELKKVRAVLDKNATGCALEALLVVDASVGQNGLQQAKVFAEICPLTGVILSKLDGSAKGGIVFSIARDLKLPVKLVGLGEHIEDLRDFEPPVFVEALFSK